MNQILCTKLKSKSNNYNLRKKQKFKIQFLSSIALFFITIFFYFINYHFRNIKEDASKQLAQNYNILKLYNNEESYNGSIYKKDGQSFAVIGMIEIPKISIYYPIISESNEELLKISPCRISGPMPNENGNLCIAGHNYDNYKFFSKVSNLSNNDEIIIHNINGTKNTYKVYKIYEVLSNDLSPLDNNDQSKKQVTLITCNNFNSSTRIIIKAISI